MDDLDELRGRIAEQATAIRYLEEQLRIHEGVRAFISSIALTAVQTAVPDGMRRQMLHEIRDAAREAKFPDWWPLA